MVDGLIADALEIVIDARDSQHEAEIDGHELCQREKLNNAIVNFHLELVDGVFFLEDALGELVHRIPERRERTGERRAPRGCPSRAGALSFRSVFFEVAFHPCPLLSQRILHFKFVLKGSVRTPSEKDLNEMKERLLWMGSLAERAVHQSVHAVLESDEQLAKRVLEEEDAINEPPDGN